VFSTWLTSPGIHAGSSAVGEPLFLFFLLIPSLLSVFEFRPPFLFFQRGRLAQEGPLGNYPRNRSFCPSPFPLFSFNSSPLPAPSQCLPSDAEPPPIFFEVRFLYFGQFPPPPLFTSPRVAGLNFYKRVLLLHPREAGIGLTRYDFPSPTLALSGCQRSIPSGAKDAFCHYFS